jgi:predicted nucleotidyltransferase
VLLRGIRRSLSLAFKHLTGAGAKPQLTQHQHDLIVSWADGVREISQVRLFGSRAVGSALPGSDIDLAVTVGHKPLKAQTVRSIWLAVGKQWDEELTTLLGHKVQVSLYNDPDSDIVRVSCDKASLRLL